jgi:serine/threonine protein kinase/tetratricopeptide (TPR) repeat protein
MTTIEETHLGPYELLEQLAMGGMATVYRAYQPSMDRQVAIKVIRGALLHDANSRERFQREARLIARLEHPHIVPIYDFDGGHEPPYIVMRYIKGSTLKDIIHSHTALSGLPVHDIIYLLQQIAAALDYAHRQGVIHRDIKPSNIILDLEGNAFLSDFGIARYSGEAGLTASGILGTPTYMAPEQSTGTGHAGPQADIYSLGVLTFELLTGTLPFEAETQLALAFKHLHEPPPDASQRNLGLPGAVDGILQRALAKKPQERFESASEFILALAAALNVAATKMSGGLQNAIETPGAANHTPTRHSTTSEQNKVVTILHADAAEYAGILNEASGTEIARSLLHEYWRRARQIVSDRRGRLVHAGETDLTVLWGAEAAREDDAEQAVRTALKLQALLRSLGGAHFIETEQEPLPLRIGVSTGMALITPQPDEQDSQGQSPIAASGSVLTLAQRLAENADGIVLISHDTYREVAGVFSMLPAEAVQLRGRREPMNTYRVTAVKARAFRVRQHGIEGLETHMVGRDAQLKQMQNAFLDATEDRETQLVTVLGEAGIGKSRLLEEFKRWAELRPEKIRLFEGRGMPEMAQHQYALWRDIFSFRFQILENDPAPLVREKMVRGLADLLGQVDLEMSHLIGHLVGFDFSASPYVKGMLADPQQLVTRARQLVIRFFARLGEARPMIMLLEDLQHADDASLDLLSELVYAQPNLPLMITGVARPVLIEKRPTWGDRQPEQNRLMLGPLDRRDCRDLARELLQKVPDLPRPLRDLLVDRSEGNPLYMEELVKMLLDDRVIVKVSGEEWRVELERLDEARVPPSLAGLLQVRLDSLLAPERLVLQRAAVIGRIFYDSALQALDAADDERDHLPDLNAILRQLAVREFIQRRETSAVAGSVEYTFTQSMLRDQIYATLLHRQVVVYHAALAEWLAASPRAGETLLRIAECYQKAGEPAKAANFYLRAGRQALDRSAPGEALSFFEQALDLLPVAHNLADPETANIEQRVDILQALGATKRMFGQFAPAQADFEAALHLAQGLNKPRLLAGVFYQLSLLADLQGDYAAVSAYLDQALPLVRQLSAPAGSETGPEEREILAQILDGRGNLGWRSGNLEKAAESIQECLALARQGEDRGLELNALITLGSIIYDFGRYDEAQSIYEQARGIAEQVGNRDRLVYTLNNLGEIERAEGNYATAVQRYGGALALSREIGNRYSEALLLFNLGMTALAQDDVQQARQNFLPSLLQALEMGAQTLVLTAITGLAWVRARTGDPASALDWLGMALNHPSADADLLHDADTILQALRQMLPQAEIEAGLAHGQSLEYEWVLQQALAEEG